MTAGRPATEPRTGSDALQKIASYQRTDDPVDDAAQMQYLALDAIEAEAAQGAAPLDVLERLASWDEMAGNGDPEDFPTLYREEVAARINLAREALEGAAPRAERLPDRETLAAWLEEDYRAEDATSGGNAWSTRKPHEFVATRLLTRLEATDADR